MKWREIFEKYPPGTCLKTSRKQDSYIAWSFILPRYKRLRIEIKNHITAPRLDFDPRENGYQVEKEYDVNLTLMAFKKLDDGHRGLIAPFLVSILLGETNAP